MNIPAESNEWGVLKTTSIQHLEFRQNENKKIPKDFEISERWIVNEQDILITRAGPTNRVGVVCVVKELTQNLILSDKTIRIRYMRSFINADFLAVILNSENVQEFILSKVVGMADSQVNISQDNLKKVKFPLPPLPIQRLIVQRIEAQLLQVAALEKEVEAQRAWSGMLLQASLQEVLQAEA